MNGKGSSPRPFSDYKSFGSNWDTVFKKSPKEGDLCTLCNQTLSDNDKKNILENPDIEDWLKGACLECLAK